VVGIRLDLVGEAEAGKQPARPFLGLAATLVERQPPQRMDPRRWLRMTRP
jgi:hypothetical protein